MSPDSFAPPPATSGIYRAPDFAGTDYAPPRGNDGALSYHDLPLQEKRSIRRLVDDAARAQRRRLMGGTLIALSCMLVVLILVGVIFTR